MKTINTDNLTWTDIDPNDADLTEIFKDQSILKVEAIDWPATDGIQFWLTDYQSVTIAEISVNESLLFGESDWDGTPIRVRISDPVPVK